MSSVKFAATKLSSAGKKGILTPDENGYYTMCIGALNVFNSAGAYYTLEGAKTLFEKSSVFMRRIANGNMKGEFGHPKKTPGMTMDDYVNRIHIIEETNVCCHFKEIWLDENYGKNNPQLKNAQLVGIMAKVKPSGPKGQALKESFENPDENVNFSIRSLSNDYYERGQLYKVVKSIICFDAVTEPGLSMANKWDNPALESFDEVFVTLKQVERIVTTESMVATEDSKIIAMESLAMFDKPAANNKPLYNKW